MFLYVSFFIMVLLCLIGAYSIADFVVKKVLQPKKSKEKAFLLIKAYGESETLEIAVQNGVLQTDLEIFILDCGMSEQTYEIAMKLSSQNSRITVVNPYDLGSLLMAS